LPCFVRLFLLHCFFFPGKRIEMNMKGKQLTYIDLFAGAGGLSEGFMREGFNPVAHVEMDRYASLTLKTRLGFYYLKLAGKENLYFKYLKGEISRNHFYSYIPEQILNSVINKEIREDTLDFIFNNIKNLMEASGIKKINLIVGGPPCQAYSLIGRARDPYRMERDKRNYLYKFIKEFLKKFQPDMFVFENVPGLLSAGKGKLWEDVQYYFKSAGYDTKYKLLNAYDFGVLQTRKRIIIIGWRQNAWLTYPAFSESEEGNLYKVADILTDLPPLQPGERMLAGSYTGPPSEYLRKYGIRRNDDILTLHIARRHNERDREIYRICIKIWLKEHRRAKYDEFPEYLKTHKNRKVFEDRFKVVAPDLSCSQTVVAHLEKDGHYFIHPDINQLRSISVREVARLQSFPDNYYFEGPMTAMFRQIGNAVPPLMARKIAEKIRKMMGEIL